MVQQPVQPIQPSFQPVNHQNPPVETPKQSKDAVDKIVQIILFSYFFVAAVLLFRFTLSMFGANKSPFVDFVRQITSPFMFPFANMFGGPVGVSNYRLEFEAIVALIVYGLVFYGLAKLIKIIFK
ncbi:YggT family protein [Patescibacteria group bacterium]|nr:YggT family protein [Patescibacteria group bacterium]